MPSNYFAKLGQLGFLVLCRSNRLGTTTMYAVKRSDIPLEDGWDVSWRTGSPVLNLDDLLARLPEWRLVDFVGDDAAKGAELLYQKLTCTGPYANWDERLMKHEQGHAVLGGQPAENMLDFLIGFEHRPESERFAPVED